MKDLQSVALNIHGEFITKANKLMEEASQNGKFSVSIRGSDDELTALIIEIHPLNYDYEMTYAIGGSLLHINWGRPK